MELDITIILQTKQKEEKNLNFPGQGWLQFTNEIMEMYVYRGKDIIH